MKFEILGEPVAKGRPKISSFGGHARAYTPTKTRNAENDIRAQIIQQLPKGFKPLQGPLKATVNFRRTMPASIPKCRRATALPMTRPDLDNYLKLLWDAFNSVVIEDDAQIVQLDARKSYGTPGITIELEAIK